MSTTRSHFLPSLDGLRALAIGAVVWAHAGLPSWILGSTGVTVFFFLSGFLITTLLRREAEATGTVSIRDFMLRRVFRIVPPMLVVVGIAIVLSLVQAIANGMTVAGAVSCLTFWQNYYVIGAGRDGLPGGMNALWSLAVEEHFYLVFPLLYLLLRRLLPRRLHQAAVLVGLCLVILGWRIWLAAHGAGYDRLYLATDTRADTLLWGAVLAIAVEPGHVPSRRGGALLTIGGVAALIAFWVVGRAPWAFALTGGYTVQALLLVPVFLAAVRVPRSLPGRLVNLRPVAYIGVISYGLYLVHRPVLELAQQHLDSRYVALAVALAGMLGLAILLRVTVERPFERLRRRFRPPVGRPAPSSAVEAVAVTP